MVDSDFGVGLAFWLIISSTVLCVWYGATNWNKGTEKVVDNDAKKWAKTEDKIVEDL